MEQTQALTLVRLLAATFGGPAGGVLGLVAGYLELGSRLRDLQEALEAKIDIRLLEFQNKNLQNELDGVRLRLERWASRADARGDDDDSSSYREILEINEEVVGLEPAFFNPPEGEEVDSAPLVLHYCLLKLTVLAGLTVYFDRVQEELPPARRRMMEKSLPTERREILVRTWNRVSTGLVQAQTRRLNVISPLYTTSRVFFFEDGDQRVGAGEDDFGQDRESAEAVRRIYLIERRAEVETAYVDALFPPLVEAFRQIPVGLDRTVGTPGLRLSSPVRFSDRDTQVVTRATVTFELGNVELGPIAFRVSPQAVSADTTSRPRVDLPFGTLRIDQVTVRFSLDGARAQDPDLAVVAAYEVTTRLPAMPYPPLQKLARRVEAGLSPRGWVIFPNR